MLYFWKRDRKCSIGLKAAAELKVLKRKGAVELLYCLMYNSRMSKSSRKADNFPASTISPSQPSPTMKYTLESLKLFFCKLSKKACVMKDPITHERDKFLIVGSRCGLCNRAVCVGTVQTNQAASIISLCSSPGDLSEKDQAAKSQTIHFQGKPFSLVIPLHVC